MANYRLSQINEEITRALAQIVRDVKDHRVNGCVLSITGTETAPDLSAARVFYSYIGDSTRKEVKEGLRSASGFIRSQLAKKLNLRQTPALTFVYDDSITKGAQISSLLHSIEGELERSKKEAAEEAERAAQEAEKADEETPDEKN